MSFSSRFLGSLLLAVVVVISGISCNRFGGQTEGTDEGADQDPIAIGVPQSVHLAFGNPSNANETDADNLLVAGDSSAFSYNNSRGTVNWVSWRTTRDDLGAAIERPDFRPDPRLPANFKRIGYYDYSGSGYDRGHMVPSADRFSNPRLNEETFMMTNIVPQTGALNQYPWNKFEQYARVQARKFDVYQIAGVYGEQGRLKGRVTVPTNCWKIIMLIPRGRSVATIDARTRIIAVDMPNVDGIEDESWEKFGTSIRAIEHKTGYDFLNYLLLELQDQIENRVELHSK